MNDSLSVNLDLLRLKQHRLALSVRASESFCPFRRRNSAVGNMWGEVSCLVDEMNEKGAEN